MYPLELRCTFLIHHVWQLQKLLPVATNLPNLGLDIAKFAELSHQNSAVPNLCPIVTLRLSQWVEYLILLSVQLCYDYATSLFGVQQSLSMTKLTQNQRGATDQMSGHAPFWT